MGLKDLQFCTKRCLPRPGCSVLRHVIPPVCRVALSCDCAAQHCTILPAPCCAVLRQTAQARTAPRRTVHHMQLATPEAAFLIDLYALLAAPALTPDQQAANAAALDAALAPPFSNPVREHLDACGPAGPVGGVCWVLVVGAFSSWLRC